MQPGRVVKGAVSAPGRGGSLLSSAAVNGRGGRLATLLLLLALLPGGGEAFADAVHHARHGGILRAAGDPGSPASPGAAHDCGLLCPLCAGVAPAATLRAAGWQPGREGGMRQPVAAPSAARLAGVALEHPTPPPRG